MSRPSFPYRPAYEDAAASLPPEEAAALRLAIICYALYDKEITMTPIVALAFTFLRPQLDKDAKQYRNGLKGGRPSTQKITQPKPTDNPTITQPKPKINPNLTHCKPKPENPQSLCVQCAEYVSMTNVEYEKLLDAYGTADTKRLIDILNNYKGSNGKQYKSDYRAILSWCADRLTEDKRKRSAAPDKTRASFASLAQRMKEDPT